MTIEQLQAENIAKFMQDGPRLRVDYHTFIVAKDTKNRRLLIGGLGCLGVGEMWSEAWDEDKNKPGFDEAPEMDTTGKKLFGIEPVGPIMPGVVFRLDEVL